VNLRSPPAAATDNARTMPAYNYYSQDAHQRGTPVGVRGTAADHRVRHVRRRRGETATERERTRTRQLNDTFDQLRRVVPTSAHDDRRRLSKIATLRLAINYVGELTTLLGHHQMSLSTDRLDDAGTVVGLGHASQSPQI